MPDPLTELENDEDVRAAIADVERERRRQAMLRRKNRFNRFKDTMIEWGTYSTYDGVAHIALADNIPTLVFWSILVFLSIVAFIYLLVITLGGYLAYNTNVNLKVFHP